MELQACEMADQIHPFIKSFGNHNTTLSTNTTAELAIYNIWYKKYFNNVNKLNYVPFCDAEGSYSESYRFDRAQQDILRTKYYIDKNPQSLTIIEAALCYGLALDYDAINQAKKDVDELSNSKDAFDSQKRQAKMEFLDKLRKLEGICLFKLLDTSIFSLFETDILTNDNLSVFGISNISDHITELFALDATPSNEFFGILRNITDMARDNEASVFKIIEQYAFLPHTLENDLLENVSDEKREEIEQKIAEIREHYTETSQAVTDATVFRTSEISDEETYDFEASDATVVDKMNMYG